MNDRSVGEPAVEAEAIEGDSLAETSGAARSGRPRDPALDRAILEATRNRLARDGYSNMTIGDIAADAGVSRPTIYRRWATKLELTVDALAYGFEALTQARPLPDLSQLPAREAFTEAVRWIDPRAINPDAMVFIGNFMGEASRTPELLRLLSQHSIEPRLAALEQVLGDLQQRGAVRTDIDVRTVASLCIGAYWAEFLRDGENEPLAEAVVATLWPSMTRSPAR
ncbi:MAG TPA: TetR/AcrR family transcriptional regulator [Pseudonocardia sp.]|jgi:AcrR family transcriptional regulator